MARITRADLFAQDSTDSGPAILEALAPLATAFNKDATGFTLPISGNVTANNAPQNAGGLLLYRSISVIGGAVVKGVGSAQVFAVHATNLAVTVRFVKLYNKATAPVVGTDVPVITLVVPAGQTTVLSAHDLGIGAFPAGIGIAATTGIADADVGAPAANEVVAHVLYA